MLVTLFASCCRRWDRELPTGNSKDHTDVVFMCWQSLRDSRRPSLTLHAFGQRKKVKKLAKE
jgi:hypothetical protein